MSRVWDPATGKYMEWDGREAHVGRADGGGRVTPRLVGPAVERFKRVWGVCLTDGCAKIAGHGGACTVRS